MIEMREGILAGGNFIVDQVKMLDFYPQQDMLTNIRSEHRSNGGGPYNVLKDLAAMQVDFPLEAVGLVGADEPGEWIIKDCAAAGINTRQLKSSGAAPTSYTDAMTVIGTGRRTFFHQRGANALLGEADFDFSETRARWFHLGYLLLLDEMDRLLEDGETVAARVLQAAQAAGLKTSVDLVSVEHPHFARIVAAALPHADVVIMNELEAGLTLGCDLRGARPQRLQQAARSVLGLGARGQVVIHCEHGAIMAAADGSTAAQAALQLPEGFVQGATGAGDAFAAGYLYGQHQELPAEHCLNLGVCVAAASLRHASPSQGVGNVEDCLHLADQFGVQPDWNRA
jgi:sugar/nucleoside kinase (ribokinase family)